ncbi:WbqC family protein [Pantoea sp.]|uniref:WbqC family protein n=1 Tax=Pantoea sp. TaxID=69393 RepID=UPI0028976518|nr:WbqC family protein [Pantoea sp.]
MNKAKIAAVMQPYLFPYLGYFQLIYASDIFVLYDDVNYIKQGYINRNVILATNHTQRLILPVHKASSFSPIKALSFSNDVHKILKQIRYAYQNKKYFKDVYPIIETILTQQDRRIAAVCFSMLTAIFSYLNLNRKIFFSSDIDYDRTGSASEKIISLCHRLGAGTYINSAGGMALYQADNFLQKNIELKFLKMREISYFQGADSFHANLSIIDVLMNCSPEQLGELLTEYDLL